MKVVKYVKSNAICIVKNGVTLAIGGGQTSRVWALENAIRIIQIKTLKILFLPVMHSSHSMTVSMSLLKLG